VVLRDPEEARASAPLANFRPSPALEESRGRDRCGVLGESIDGHSVVRLWSSCHGISGNLRYSLSSFLATPGRRARDPVRESLHRTLGALSADRAEAPVPARGCTIFTFATRSGNRPLPLKPRNSARIRVHPPRTYDVYRRSTRVLRY